MLNQYKTVPAEPQIVNPPKTMVGNLETVAKGKKFIIATFGAQGSSGYSISKFPVFHDTEAEAVKERTRLAKAFPGTFFIVLQVRSAEMIPAQQSFLYN